MGGREESMNTNNIQIVKTLDSVIRDIIRSGNKPLVTNVIKECAKRFKGSIPGYPWSIPDIIQHHEATNPERYNKFFRNAVNDIKLLYDMVTDQLHRMVLDMDYQLTWRSRIKSKLRRLDSLINQINTEGSNIFYENFADLTNINNDTLTAYVNLPEDLVTLPENTVATARVYPEISSITLGQSKQISDINNILDDSINSAWIAMLEKNNKDKCQIDMTILFKDTIKINKVFAVGLGPKDQMLNVTLLTASASDKLGALDCNSYKNASWYFDNKEVTGVQLTVSKTEYDNFVNNKYQYFFGLQALEFYNNSYMPAGEWNTNKLEFRDPFGVLKSINKIKLESDEKCPSDCYIKYYISSNNSNWREIKPGEEIILNEYREFTHTTTQSDQFQVNSDRSNNLYKLTSDAFSYVPEGATDIKLFRNCPWRVQYYYYDRPSADSLISYTEDKPTVENFTNTMDLNPTAINWVGWNTDKFFSTIDGKSRMIMYTMYITCGTTEVVKSAPMTIDWIDDNKRNIYLNGSKVYSNKVKNSDGTYYVEFQLNLKQGINEFNFVTNDYKPSTLAPTGEWSLSDIQYLEQMLLTKCGAAMNCDKYPMIQVSEYELMYNTRQSDPSRFAVITKYGDVLVNYAENIEHKIKYKCVPNANKIYQMYLKGVLSRKEDTQPHFTPQLRSVKLTVTE